METELAEMRATMSALALAPEPNENHSQSDNDPAESLHNSQEFPAGGPRSSHLIHGIEDQPRPCKASLLVNPGDGSAAWSYLDCRFNQDRRLSGKPSLAFSSEFLWCAKAGYEFGRDEFPVFILRHANAVECPVGEGCTHWQWIRGREATREEGAIDLQVVCITAETMEKGIYIFNEGPMFESDEAITIAPCQIFNALSLEFSVIKAAGYDVVLFRLVEDDVDIIDCLKWIDQHGRLLARMD
ncbi:hypothetical protein ACHAPJ_009026 [Fusarium lateritium]